MVKHSIMLDLVFGALADPTRREILRRLSKGSATVTELAEPHEMSLPAISKHLKVLEHAGLITRTRDGRLHHIGLEPKAMQNAVAWMEYYKQFLDSKLDALKEYLENEQSTGEDKA
jgi:DNA-binding transcriptional ArsR family regulator